MKASDFWADSAVFRRAFALTIEVAAIAKKAILVEKQPSHDFSFILALPLFLELAMLPTQCYIVWTELEFLDGFYSGFPVFWSLSLGPSRVFLENLQALPCNFTNSQQTSQKQSRNRCSSIFVGHSCRITATSMREPDSSLYSVLVHINKQDPGDVGARERRANLSMFSWLQHVASLICSIYLLSSF